MSNMLYSNQLYNTLLMQRSFIGMNDDMIAAYHGWTKEQLQKELAGCAKHMKDCGIEDSNIMSSLKIDESTLQAALKPQLDNTDKMEIVSMISQVALLTATVNEMKKKLYDCENEVERLRKDMSRTRNTSPIRDMHDMRLAGNNQNATYDDCGTWRSQGWPDQ